MVGVVPAAAGDFLDGERLDQPLDPGVDRVRVFAGDLGGPDVAEELEGASVAPDAHVVNVASVGGHERVAEAAYDVFQPLGDSELGFRVVRGGAHESLGDD